MKKILFALCWLASFSAVKAQSITGQWNGVLKVEGMALRLVLHIEKKDNGYSATMDSPDQGATGMPVSRVVFEHPKLRLEIDNLNVKYEGEWKDSVLSGTFTQSNLSVPLEFSRQAVAIKKVEPYQELAIKAPLPYSAEEITFPNKTANIILAGTLTLPAKKGRVPAVILISGSGKQNRDEEILGHKPFLVIADYLTRRGIAVLRYDDRGAGGSTGDFASATSTDFATDVESAITYLKNRPEIDTRKIGLVGHSEGGMIAPMVAAKSKNVGFIVLLAGPGIPCSEIILLQKTLIERADGIPEKMIRHSDSVNRQLVQLVKEIKNDDTLRQRIIRQAAAAYWHDSTVVFLMGRGPDELAQLLVSPWMKYFIRFNPSPVLQQVRCPVLALNGSKDLQVPAKENLVGIAAAFRKSGNRKVTIKELQGLNHLFQECDTGSPGEYFRIAQTFSPQALEAMGNWIAETVK